MTDLLNTLNISNEAILELAKTIKVEQRNEAKLLEEKRVERVNLLIDSIYELHPQKSSGIIKELFKSCKASDFSEKFIHIIGGTINICSYDGQVLTNYKQNGEISVKQLSYKVFVEVYGCNFQNYFLNGIISYSFFEENTKTEIVSSECFEIWKNKAIENYVNKASKNIDTNLSNIYKNKLQNLGLLLANKSIKAQNKINAKKNKIASKGTK